MATITLSTSKKDVIITMMGTGSASINWGDNNIENYTLSNTTVTQCKHSYEVGRLPRLVSFTITITGNGITVLGCSKNELTALTLKDCTSLTWLGCYSNLLTTLDVSECPALETLACANNTLNSLNINGCRRLITLSCHHNQLTSLLLKGTGKLTTKLKPLEPEPKLWQSFLF